ncbi:MAG: thermonuclease family protein [Pseudomonadota bacterium]
MHSRKGQPSLLKLAVAGFIIGAVGGGVVLFPPNFSALNPVTPDSDARSEAGVEPVAQAAAPAYAHHFNLCFTGGGTNCVVDGDTMWVERTRIRIADIDAPETHPPHCAHEADLGRRATRRLQELLNEGPFELESIDRNEDVYGRKLRIVTRHGRSLGMILVDEGLARQWTGQKTPWC